ncbi:hypothetical protein [Curvivirga aplysinae]|uniref:hypothetical protein n=1 Tax=Curvivirga aplysinae TaxID=2529852 RepID=UPI0012BB6706|nr:hypothetical protein [Curvivirga aplysinae]MTI10517.1 hypothetical protein [Curvivirga aplysinae]
MLINVWNIPSNDTFTFEEAMVSDLEAATTRYFEEVDQLKGQEYRFTLNCLTGEKIDITDAFALAAE